MFVVVEIDKKKNVYFERNIFKTSNMRQALDFYLSKMLVIAKNKQISLDKTVTEELFIRDNNGDNIEIPKYTIDQIRHMTKGTTYYGV